MYSRVNTELETPETQWNNAKSGSFLHVCAFLKKNCNMYTNTSELGLTVYAYRPIA